MGLTSVRRVLFPCLLFLFMQGVLAEDVSGGGQAQPPEISVPRLMAQAKQALQQGDMTGALAQFEAILQIDPNNAEALYHSGTIYLRTNQVQKGLDNMKRSADLVPNNQRVRLNLAIAYETMRLFDQADDSYSRVLAVSQTSPEGVEASRRVRLLRAKRFGDQKNFAAATEIFQAILSENPKDTDALQGMGLTYYLQGKWDESLEYYEKLVQFQPNNADAYRLLGEIYERKGQPERAKESYELVLKFAQPDAPVARIATLRLAIIQGLAALAHDDFRLAATEFEKALTVDSHDVVANFNLASIYHDHGKPEEAANALKRILEGIPDHLDAKLRLGQVYIEMRNYEEGVRQLEDILFRAKDSQQAQVAGQILNSIYSSSQEGRSLQQKMLGERAEKLKLKAESSPDDFDAHFNLGMIYLSQRREDLAKPELEKAAKLRPDYERLQYNLAVLYDENGQFDDALPAFSQALEQEKDEQVKNNIRVMMKLSLAKKFFYDNQPDLAEEQFREIIKEKPDDFIPHFFLALIYSRGEKLADAITEYQEVVRIVPSHASARLNLAMLYEQSLREEDAMIEYRAIVQLGQPQQIADAAKKRLEGLQKRIGGFSYSVGYAWSYDANSNLSQNNPIGELRSDLSGSINFRYKLDHKPITFGVSANPTYSVYHKGQYDYFRMDWSPSVNYARTNGEYGLRYSYGYLSSLLEEQRMSESKGLSANGSWRFKMFAIPRFLAEQDEKKASPSGVQTSFSYNTSTSAANPIFDAAVYSLNLSLNQSLGGAKSWSLSYGLTDNVNVYNQGSDYAYFGHNVTLRLDKRFASGIAANISYSGGIQNYKNPDSVTQFTSKRKLRSQTWTTGFSYFIAEQLVVYGNLSYNVNKANLPTGYILSPQDVTEAIGVQSPSLGSYKKLTGSLGINLSF